MFLHSSRIKPYHLLVGSLDLKASQGDVGHAVGLLTTKPAELHDAGEDPDSHTQAWEAQKGRQLCVSVDD